MIHGALGPFPGCVQMSQGSKIFSGDAAILKDGESPTVPCYSIDRLPSWLRSQIDAIFLDVEGYELCVLQGGARTIAVNKPLILVEELPSLMQRYGVGEGEIAIWLASRGYRAVQRLDRDVIYVARGEARG